MPSLTGKTLHDRRRSMIGWSVGLAGLVGVMCAYWPTIRDSPDLQSFMNELPEGLRAFVGSADYGSAAGYLDAELFSFMVPLLLLVVGIGMGARAIAGEEERGTIDLLLSTPITRRRVVLEKVAGGVVVLLTLGAVLFVALLAGAAVVDMDLPAGRLAAIATASVLVVLPFGALALAISCATGSRGPAAGTAGAAAVAAFMLEAIGPLVPSLDGWRELSPWNWYASDEVLASGLQLGNVALLIAVACALTAVAVVSVERRDLAV